MTTVFAYFVKNQAPTAYPNHPISLVTHQRNISRRQRRSAINIRMLNFYVSNQINLVTGGQLANFFNRCLRLRFVRYHSFTSHSYEKIRVTFCNFTFERVSTGLDNNVGSYTVTCGIEAFTDIEMEKFRRSSSSAKLYQGA